MVHGDIIIVYPSLVRPPLVWKPCSHDAFNLGRRVLHAYLTLFLHSQDASGLPVFHTETSQQMTLPQHNYDDLCGTIINTYALGEHVGREWQLERIMRWTPARVSCPIKNWDDLLSVDFIANRYFTINKLRPVQSPWRYSRGSSGRGVLSIRVFSSI